MWTPVLNLDPCKFMCTQNSYNKIYNFEFKYLFFYYINTTVVTITSFVVILAEMLLPANFSRLSLVRKVVADVLEHSACLR